MNEAQLGQVAELARVVLYASEKRRFLSWCGVMDALFIAPGTCYIRAMKKILLAALFLTVLATPAFAAKHHHHHHHHHAASHPHA